MTSFARAVQEQESTTGGDHAKSIRVHGLTRTFGEVTALDHVDLDVIPGESLALLGPSGSGKSTFLRAVAGLEEIDSGEITIGGVPQQSLPPHRRDVAIVFQNFALYPHLDALRNITLGLVHGLGMTRGDAELRARAVAQRLQITELLGRRPREMSGGQRQRVALARALARQAGVVLLDEPLSGMDAQLHVVLREEIATLLRSSGATSIHVTHDQQDAFAVADRVAVIHRGRIEQIGTPRELYSRPTTAFVAGFIGTPPMNLAEVRVRDGYCTGGFLEGVPLEELGGMPVLRGRDRFRVGIRPDDLRLGTPGDSRDRVIGVTVTAVSYEGGSQIVRLSRNGDVAGGTLSARMTADASVSEGDRLSASWSRGALHVFDAETGIRIDADR